MKTHLLLAAFLAGAFSSCKKNGTDAARSAAVSNSSAGFKDTVKVAITDLGTKTYFGIQGGLYPGGTNDPSGQYKKDLKNFAKAIMPLNQNGAIDSVVGKICFISLGASPGGRMMDSLIQKTLRHPGTNPFLKLITCNNGASTASLNNIMDPNDPYWDHVYQVMIASFASYNQVEVVYLETEDSTSIQDFPARPYIVRDDLEAVMRTCKAKFKNLKLMYVLGRKTTFDVHAISNIEPTPYYNGWADKFAIEDQINGVPGTEYKGANAVAPLLTWGWYQWTDGSDIPRQDGFVWQENDTRDGIHATPEGEDTLSTRFQNFLLTDRYANTWYANHVKPGIIP